MNIEVKNSVKPIEYSKSIQVLEKRVKDVFEGKKKELIWILEHKDVYTAGTNFREQEILDKKIKITKTNRGGKITYHGPGQKIVYFVLDLNKREKDIRKLLNKIENCIVDILKEYNVYSFADKKNIGIWVLEKNNTKKIAAIGIRVKKWIAYHGFALNINADLKKYDAIVPCGIKNKKVTNLSVISKNKFKNINKVIVRKFLSTFL
jgi:lipoyl(octanoyl) transferase